MEAIIQNMCLVGFIFYYVTALTSVSIVRAVEYVEQEDRAISPVAFGHEDLVAEREHQADLDFVSRASVETPRATSPVRERTPSVDSTGSLQRTNSGMSVSDAVQVDGFDFKLEKAPGASAAESVDTSHWGTLGQIAADIEGGYSLQEVLDYAQENPKYKGEITTQQIVDEYYRQKGLGAAQPVVDALFDQVRKANVRVLTDMKPADLVNLLEQSKNIPTSLKASAKLPSRYGGVSDPVSGKFMTIQDAVRYVTEQMQNPESKMYQRLSMYSPADFKRLQTVLA
jgi:hypothetical protein